MLYGRMHKVTGRDRRARTAAEDTHNLHPPSLSWTQPRQLSWLFQKARCSPRQRAGKETINPDNNKTNRTTVLATCPPLWPASKPFVQNNLSSDSLPLTRFARRYRVNRWQKPRRCAQKPDCLVAFVCPAIRAPKSLFGCFGLARRSRFRPGRFPPWVSPRLRLHPPHPPPPILLFAQPSACSQSLGPKPAFEGAVCFFFFHFFFPPLLTWAFISRLLWPLIKALSSPGCFPVAMPFALLVLGCSSLSERGKLFSLSKTHPRVGCILASLCAVDESAFSFFCPSSLRSTE
jgi:hypothetical protein